MEKLGLGKGRTTAWFAIAALASSLACRASTVFIEEHYDDPLASVAQTIDMNRLTIEQETAFHETGEPETNLSKALGGGRLVNIQRITFVAGIGGAEVQNLRAPDSINAYGRNVDTNFEPVIAFIYTLGAWSFGWIVFVLLPPRKPARSPKQFHHGRAGAVVQ